MNIPLVDLTTNYRAIEAEVDAAVRRVLASGQYIGGPEVEAFEAAYARFVGAGHCVGVANGTDAVELMVRCLELGPSDHVLVPANSFIASALGVVRAGAGVTLVDCTPHSLIDVDACEAAMHPGVKAVMPVHLFGQCADMEAVEALARRHHLAILEDAAQAQGATRLGRAAGAMGLMAATSFYPGKNLGAYGDAGAVTTSDPALAERLRCLRNYGSEVKYSHPRLGFNSRLDPLQAAILSVKLGHLGEWNRARRDAAARYAELLAGVPGVELPPVLPGNQPIWHVYAVRVDAPVRDRVMADMKAAGVGVGLHYPVPIHLQGAFRHLGHREGAFPVAERLAREMISLPMYPELTAAQQRQVVDALVAALARAGTRST